LTRVRVDAVALESNRLTKTITAAKRVGCLFATLIAVTKTEGNSFAN
jgi:hypothetical protein